jgi:hypothetical protein
MLALLILPRVFEQLVTLPQHEIRNVEMQSKSNEPLGLQDENAISEEDSLWMSNPPVLTGISTPIDVLFAKCL